MSKPRSTLTFVLPYGSDRISGGNVYNQRLLQGLQTVQPVSILRVCQWCQTLQSLGPGVFVVDSLNLEDLAACAHRRQPGQRFVLIVHHLPSLEPDFGDSGVLDKEKMALFQCDGFITTGAFTEEILRHRGFAPIINLSPPGVAAASPIRDYQSPVRALMVNNLIPRKGVLEFLRELRGVDLGTGFGLDILGRVDMDPGYAADCADCIAQSPTLTGIVGLHGPVDYDGVIKWYEAANVFVSASRMETFGMALQEAAQHGLPIVAVRGGNSASHVVSGQTGETFATPAAMARGLPAFVDRLPDYFRRAQNTQRGPAVSWEGLARTLLETLVEWNQDWGGGGRSL